MNAPATALNLAACTGSDDPDSPIIAWRDPAAGTRPLSLVKHMYVERGTLEDWQLLHELHYKASQNGIGPRYVRLVIDDGVNPSLTIGVMVFTVPKPLDSGRNQVFPHMRPNQNGRDTRLINVQRMAWINKNLILSSRTVLDTMYRGGGIAYRFKNIGYRLMGFRYVESRSSMSRYNPFSIKAGMRFVKPKSAPAFESGLAFFARHFKSPAYDYVAIKAEIEAMPDYLREHTLKELRAFYYRNSSMEKSGDNRLNGTSRVETMELGYLLKQTQQLVFGATVYAAWTNPDWDPNTQAMRPLPARIPLAAFENQGVDEPLRLDLLETAA
jgi:uncharacterized protein